MRADTARVLDNAHRDLHELETQGVELGARERVPLRDRSARRAPHAKHDVCINQNAAVDSIRRI